MEHTDSTSQESATASVPAPAAARAADSRDRPIGAVVAALMVIGMAVGYLTDNPRTGDVIAFFVLIGLWLVAIALLVTRFAPRWRAAGAERATRTALILGVLAVVTCVGFWTGLPFPLGAGAIMLGLTARESAPPDARGKPTVALVLGGFAVLASFVTLLIG